MKLVTYFLIILPILAEAPLEVYFIDGVLKYRFQNRKLAYIVAAFISVVTAVVTLAICLDENGHIAMTPSYDIISIASSFSILVLMLLNMKEKLWKKLVVFFLTDMMLDTIYVILSSFREMFYMSLAPESAVGKAILMLLLEILIIVFKLGIFTSTEYNNTSI